MATPIPISDLTQASLTGEGVFDVLMKATKAHLDAEFAKNRIRGPEYATVYLRSLESVMANSLNFLVQRQRVALEAELMAQQVLLTQAEVAKANAQVLIAQAELQKVQLEADILRLTKDKIPVEIAHVQAQTDLVGQQKTNLEAEGLNIPKQGLILDATKCKLDAEYDVLLNTNIKVTAETNLLNQKTLTERAQVTSVGVDADSIVGRQKSLYQAQTTGFTRDAEQKAAKLMVDTWNVRRTTDEGTSANDTNQLTDAAVGRAVSKLLAGVGA